MILFVCLLCIALTAVVPAIVGIVTESSDRAFFTWLAMSAADITAFLIFTHHH